MRDACECDCPMPGCLIAGFVVLAVVAFAALLLIYLVTDAD